MRKGKIGLGLMAAAILLGGCGRAVIPDLPAAAKDYYRQLAPGESALRKITDPADLPDFRPAFDGDRSALLAALDQSVRYFGYPSSRKYYPVQDITHARAVAGLVAFRETLNSASTADEFQERVVNTLDVYESVGCDSAGTVLFTGYYTPIFDASLTQTAEFRWPLYKMPSDLEKGPEGETLGRRTTEGSLVPHYTRGEIDAGALKGLELVWLKDRFDAYVCTVQGSAQLRLPDGSLFKIGYAANNGKEYAGIGPMLVKEGRLPVEKLTLSGLTEYFQQHPEMMDQYLPRNERYVFFQETEKAPTGSLGLPVTPYRSIATDKSLFPRGCLAFVQTQVPASDGALNFQQAPFRQFVLDQDAGGAIRAAGRCDIYLGIGSAAGRIAGWTLSEGRLYYLALKE